MSTIIEMVTRRVENMERGTMFRSSEFVNDFMIDYPMARKNTIVNALSILREKGALIQDKTEPQPWPFYVGEMPKKVEQNIAFNSPRGAYRR